jgi:hypothetical protein
MGPAMTMRKIVTSLLVAVALAIWLAAIFLTMGWWLG